MLALIYFFSMTDFYNHDIKHIVFYLKNDPIVTDSDPI